MTPGSGGGSEAADTAETLVETVRAALSGASEAAILAQGTAKSRERVRDSWKPVFAALSVLAERLAAERETGQDTWGLLQQSWECQRAAEARLKDATDALRAADYLIEGYKAIERRTGVRNFDERISAYAAARAVLVGGDERAMGSET